MERLFLLDQVIIQLVCGMLLQENDYRYLQDIQSSINSVAFSPDGKTVLTGSRDNTACLWNATTGEQLQVLTGHTESITSIAFSPDGKTLITGSEDTTARVWKCFQWNEITKSLFMKYYPLLTESIYTIDKQQL